MFAKLFKQVLPAPKSLPMVAERVTRREQLWQAMINRTPVRVGNITGIVNGIGAEDGSGYSFNVTLSVGVGNSVTIHVRTMQ